MLLRMNIPSMLSTAYRAGKYGGIQPGGASIRLRQSTGRGSCSVVPTAIPDEVRKESLKPGTEPRAAKNAKKDPLKTYYSIHPTYREKEVHFAKTTKKS